jgi:hypothetical protein
VNKLFDWLLMENGFLQDKEKVSQKSCFIVFLPNVYIYIYIYYCCCENNNYELQPLLVVDLYR